MSNLTSQNFNLVQTQNGTRRMNANFAGNVLVFFKSPNCGVCNRVKPAFDQLMRSDKRINYGICDVTQHQSVIQMSLQTDTPIKVVPTFILYSDQKPFARFTGKTLDQNALSSFITNALNAIKMKPSNVAPPQPRNNYNPTSVGGATPMPTALRANKQTYQPIVEDDDCEDRLECPPHIIPKNEPWTKEMDKVSG